MSREGHKEYGQTYKKIDEYEKSTPPINVQLITLHNKLAESNEKIGTLVISGHSGFDGFQGETNLTLTQNELNQLVGLTNNLFSETKHVLLMGCYSNTLSANKNWRTSDFFKNATLIGGFGGRAPLRNQSASSNYIKETLLTADKLDLKLIQAKSSNQISPDLIKEFFQSLKSLQQTFSAIDYCYVYMNRAPVLVKDCFIQWKEFNALYEKNFNNYIGDLSILPNENPPRIKRNSRNNPTSKLREYYNNVQAMCPRPESIEYLPNRNNFASNNERDAAIQKTIRAIFWWDIQKNYSENYKNKINVLNGQLNNMKINIKLPVLDGNLGRIEFLKSMQEIKNKIDELKNADTKSEDCTIRKICSGQILENQFLEAYSPLIELDERIPANWL